MRLLVDTNVALDALARREPFYEKARLLFLLGYAHEAELWMSASQMTDVFYIYTGGRRSLAIEGKKRMKLLRKCVHVVTFGEAEFDEALSSTWADLEDACVYQAARRAKADFIITRDTKGFKQSPIRVFDCDEFFDYLEREKGIVYDEVEF
ncbi:MAG: PIN domain-containing protein [Eggerthellaceae bacterium]|nr:PIN domain-containing protein [Eggerthellaceae bacterium]